MPDRYWVKSAQKIGILPQRYTLAFASHPLRDLRRAHGLGLRLEEVCPTWQPDSRLGLACPSDGGIHAAVPGGLVPTNGYPGRGDAPCLRVCLKQMFQ